jgi:uncharacterized protein (PEP-CTERM system associated)
MATTRTTRRPRTFRRPKPRLLVVARLADAGDRSGAIALLLVASACVASLGDAMAQTFRLEPAIAAEVQVSDNVNLAPADKRRGDVITLLTPVLRFTEQGAHTSLDGNIGLPIVSYARSGGTNVQPEVSVQGLAELYPRLLFVDASVQIAPSYANPFAAQPQNVANTTSNRYTSQTYRVSPYVKGDAPGNLHYLLRDDNVWTAASGAPSSATNSYENDIKGQVLRDPRPLGWSVDYQRTQTRFQDQGSFVEESERVHALMQTSYQWEWSLDGGYEDNRYPLARYSGAIYGVGLRWRPSDRTSVDAAWEYRFFGGSYHVAVDYRTPLSVWNLTASRDITNYPQQASGLAKVGDVGSLLNQIFASRFPDVTQRQAFIDELIRDRGLPAVLAGAVAPFTQEVLLATSLRASWGLIGVRNSVLVGVYRQRNEPIVSAFPGLPQAFSDNTQVGSNVVWTYRLTSLYTLALNADWLRTTANGNATGRTTQVTFTGTVSAPISARTSLFAGARYQRFLSDVNDSYREAAAFLGVSHVFK